MTTPSEKGCCPACKRDVDPTGEVAINWCADGRCPCHKDPQEDEELGYYLIGMEDRLKDQGDERYGLVKHRNNILTLEMTSLRSYIQSLLRAREASLRASIRKEIVGKIPKHDEELSITIIGEMGKLTDRQLIAAGYAAALQAAADIVSPPTGKEK